MIPLGCVLPEYQGQRDNKNDKMQLIAKLLDGTLRTVSVSSDCCVGDVVKAVAEQEHINAHISSSSSFHLVHNGRCLRDDSTLSAAQVLSAGDTVFSTLSLNGGGRSKPNHKGKMRHFTNGPEEVDKEKEARLAKWREKHGNSDEEDEEESEGEEEENDPFAKDRQRAASRKVKVDQYGIPIESSEEESDESESDDDMGEPQLTRREREEIEKQEAARKYEKMHAAGKTEEARADLARLAIIRKQREDAAKKREALEKAKAKKGGR